MIESLWGGDGGQSSGDHFLACDLLRQTDRQTAEIPFEGFPEYDWSH